MVAFNDQDSRDEAGLAYAFFDCKASKAEITELMPQIREFASTPSELELELETINPNILERELRTIALLQMARGCKYQVRTKLPGYDNKRAADETADILNQAYQSPLYSDGEKFIGKVIYKKDGRYVSRE